MPKIKNLLEALLARNDSHASIAHSEVMEGEADRGICPMDFPEPSTSSWKPPAR